MLTILILFVSLLVQQADSGLQQEAEEQAQAAIQHILSGEQEEVAFWTLLMLTDYDSNLEKFVEDALKQSGADSLIYIQAFLSVSSGSAESLHERTLRRFKNGALGSRSELLSIAYATFTDSQSAQLFYDEAGKHFKNKELLRRVAFRETVSDSVLSAGTFRMEHFFMLYAPDRHVYFDKAYLEKALSFWVKQAPGPFLSASITKAASFDLQEDWVAAEQAANLSEFYKIPLSNYQLRALSLLEVSSFFVGNYDTAIKIISERQLPLAEFLNDTGGLIQLKIRHGSYLYTIGKYEGARNNFQLLEDKYSKIVPARIYAQILNNKSIANYMLGETQSYLNDQLKSLDEARNSTNLDIEASILNNLYVFNKMQKKWNASYNYLLEAQRAAISIGDDLLISDSNLSFATYYWGAERNFTKSMKYFNKALELIEPDVQYTKYMDILFEIASLYIENGMLIEAEEVYTEMKQLSSVKSNTKHFLESLLGIAYLRLQLGDIEAVNEQLKALLMYELKELDFEQIVKYQAIKAGVYFKKGNYVEAYEVLSPVVESIFERAKSSTDVESGYWDIQPEFIFAFKTQVEILMSLKKGLLALDLLDQIKTINDATFYGNPLVKSRKLSDRELTRDLFYTSELNALHKDLLAADLGSRGSIQSKIDQVRSEREQMLSKVRLPEFIEKVPLEVLQRKLGTSEVILHVTQLGSTWYKALIYPEKIEFETLTFGEETRALYERVSRQLTGRFTNLEDLYSVYKHLKLSGIPADIQKIYVIPDSYLYRIPLDVLPVSKPKDAFSYGGTEYFIESRESIYLSSLQEFLKNTSVRNSEFQVGLNAYGISNFDDVNSLNPLNPLPNAVREVAGFEGRYDNMGSKKLFTEEEASKKAFKENIAHSRIVHVATHSEVSEQDPLFSALYLKGDKDRNESGVMYAYEFYDLNLKCDLIVLNSCSSGSGDYIQGTGVLGISRALRYAGAKSLLINLWEVNDKLASDFSALFYEELNKGYSKTQAMRNAKLSTLQTGNANPHFWGVYMIVGNPSPIARPTSVAADYARSSVVFLLIVLLWFLSQRRRAT